MDIISMDRGYTMVPNWLFSHALILPSSHFKVLLFIIRRTLGWHKTEDTISLSQFQHGVGHNEQGTGLARSTVITALQSLQKGGYIDVVRMTAAAGDLAPSLFRLGRLFTTTLAGLTGHQVARKSDLQIENNSKNISTSSNHADDDVFATPLETKPSLEQAPVADPGNRLLSSTTGSPTTPLRLSEPLIAGLSSDPDIPTNDIDTLLKRLMAAPIGYSHQSAMRIIEQFPIDRIEAGLANLRYRPEVRNPAGYLLRELQTGGYTSPVSPSRPRRSALFALPTMSELPTPQPVVTEDRLQEAIAALDEATRQAWLLEARTQHARLAGKPVEKVPEDSILVQATFENLVYARRLAA